MIIRVENIVIVGQELSATSALWKKSSWRVVDVTAIFDSIDVDHRQKE